MEKRGYEKILCETSNGGHQIGMSQFLCTSNNGGEFGAPELFYDDENDWVQKTYKFGGWDLEVE